MSRIRGRDTRPELHVRSALFRAGFHQHFNTGTTPARYLAFKHEGVAIRNAQGVPKAWISKRAGGDQIDYADERPEIRAGFTAELAKHGLSPKMDAAYAAEQVELAKKAG